MPIPHAIPRTVDDYRDTPKVRNSDGVMRAYTYVEMTDINGRSIRRRVSLGVDWNTELETARDTMERTRANNPSLRIEGDFRINL